MTAEIFTSIQKSIWHIDALNGSIYELGRIAKEAKNGENSQNETLSQIIECAENMKRTSLCLSVQYGSLLGKYGTFLDTLAFR